MQRREFLKSALIGPAVLGTGAGIANAETAGSAASPRRTVSLAYWSAERAWMIAADPSAKPADDVSPFLSLPGRHFANLLLDLGILTASTANTPHGIIAPADFAGPHTEQTAISALTGILTDHALTVSDVAAWIVASGMTDIWAEIAHADGWHPLPIGALAPTTSVLTTPWDGDMPVLAPGLTGQVLATTGAAVSVANPFNTRDVAGVHFGTSPAALIASHGQAGVRMQPQSWRMHPIAGLTATGPVIGVFFDLDWWRNQPLNRRRAIETAAQATLHWHLAQQQTADRLLARSLPDLAADHSPTPGEAELIAQLSTCSTLCQERIRGSATAAAMIGPLIELGMRSGSRYPSA